MFKNILIKFTSSSLLVIYGVLCFLCAPLIFLISGFYISCLIFTIINLMIFYLIPSNYYILYIIIGLFSSFWGLGILTMNIKVKQSLDRHLNFDEEIKYGLESMNDSIISILTSSLVACFSYAIITLLDIGNDGFRIIIFYITFSITLFTILINLRNIYSDNYNKIHGKENSESK